jgi:hypothetical protein
MPELRWRQVFDGEEPQLGVMRRWIKSLLPDCPVRDDVLSVATELSGNAICHTASGRGGWFAVEVTWSGPVVRIGVADSGAATEPRVIEDPDGEHGRGLLVVRELSVRMGVCGDARGRLTWADIRWDASVQAAMVAPDAYEDAIRAGQAALARRFAGVPAWFGRATMAWWALPHSGELVSAPTAQELAALLYRLLDARSPSRPGHTHQHPNDAAGGRQFRDSGALPGSVRGSHGRRGPGAGHPSSPDGGPGRPRAAAGKPSPALVSAP